VTTIDVIIVDLIEKDACPLMEYSACTIEPITCRYGLTEITVPKDCPLRSRTVRINRATRRIRVSPDHVADAGKLTEPDD